MNTLSRTITGIAMIVGGLWMFIAGFFAEETPWILWLYGTLVLILGFFVFFNKKEDTIEQIKSQGGKK